MTKLLAGFGLMVLTLALLSPAVPASAAPRLSIVTEKGVSDQVRAEIQAAADTTMIYFRETYGVELSRDVRVVVVPDKDSYARAHMRELRVDQGEAERRARTTAGWSRGDTILVNAGSLRNRAQRTFLISHEMVHQYQDVVCRGAKCSQFRWLREGSGDALAALMVDRVGAWRLDQYRDLWARTIADAPGTPVLSDLHSDEAWYAALDQYGDITYRTAGMAGLALADRQGFESLLGYYIRLDSGDAEGTFWDTFGQPLPAFEAEFNPLL